MVNQFKHPLFVRYDSAIDTHRFSELDQEGDYNQTGMALKRFPFNMYAAIRTHDLPNVNKIRFE